MSQSRWKCPTHISQWWERGNINYVYYLGHWLFVCLKKVGFQGEHWVIFFFFWKSSALDIGNYKFVLTYRIPVYSIVILVFPFGSLANPLQDSKKMVFLCYVYLLDNCSIGKLAPSLWPGHSISHLLLCKSFRLLVKYTLAYLKSILLSGYPLFKHALYEYPSHPQKQTPTFLNTLFIHTFSSAAAALMSSSSRSQALASTFMCWGMRITF